MESASLVTMKKYELIQRIMQLGHDAMVFSGKEESEEREDSKSDEYKSEEKKECTNMQTYWFYELVCGR